MATQYADEDIILEVHYRFTDFTISLRDWITREMYKEPQWQVQTVKHKNGETLPLSAIPPQYRNRTDDAYQQHTLWNGLLSKIRSLWPGDDTDQPTDSTKSTT